MVRTTPDDEFDHKVLADVENHGWHLVAIADDENGPAYVFSVGIFHTLNHPEICIFGLSSTKVMGQIINSIGDMVSFRQACKTRFLSLAIGTELFVMARSPF